MSWKTTVAGIFAGAAALIDAGGDWPPVVEQILQVLVAVGVAAGFIVSRDNDVSSERAGAK